MADETQYAPMDPSIRARIHKLADTVQEHELKLSEHSVRIERLDEDSKSMATSSQLAGSIENVKNQLTGATQLMELRVKGIADSLEKIVSSQTWIIRLVVGAVILAGLALLFKKP